MSGQHTLTDDYASSTDCFLVINQPQQPQNDDDEVNEIREAYDREQERCQKLALKKASKRKPDTPLYELDEQDSTLAKDDLKKIKKAKKSKAYRDQQSGTNKQVWGYVGTLLENERILKAKHAATMEENQTLKGKVSDLEKQVQFPEADLNQILNYFNEIADNGNQMFGVENDQETQIVETNHESKEMAGDNDEWRQMLWGQNEWKLSGNFVEGSQYTNLNDVEEKEYMIEDMPIPDLSELIDIPRPVSPID